MLARVLAEPRLPERIRALSPTSQGRLLDEVGLEDASEIVGLATTSQLARILDDDVWRQERATEDPRFDPARFALWLAVMLEVGEEFTGARLSELDEDLVVLAFHSELVVLDVEVLRERLEDDDEGAERFDKALADALSEDLDGFQVVARHPAGWDDVLAALLALDRENPERARRVLERCAVLGADALEEAGGLHEVLSAEETLEADVAADREERLLREGFVQPSHAKAFLALARRPSEDHDRDPLTRAHFRDAGSSREVGPARDEPAASRSLLGLLEREPGSRSLSEPPTSTPSTSETPLARALRSLASDDVVTFRERSDELAYLANVLRVGIVVGGEPMEPFDAVAAALAVTNLGLEMSVASRQAPVEGPEAEDAAVRVLASTPADVLFRRAFAVLDAEIVSVARARGDADGLAEPCPRLGNARFLATLAELSAARAQLAPGRRGRGRTKAVPSSRD
ncbi:MAG: DUF6178 family protein [Polyangiaceae bacterium]